MSTPNCGWSLYHPFPNRPGFPRKFTGRQREITTEALELLGKGNLWGHNIHPRTLCPSGENEWGKRSAINLRGLNQFVRTEHFKMEGLYLLSDLLQPQDWMVKTDLKDAYLKIPIHSDYQHLLTFKWEKKTFKL